MNQAVLNARVITIVFANCELFAPPRTLEREKKTSLSVSLTFTFSSEGPNLKTHLFLKLTRENVRYGR